MPQVGKKYLVKIKPTNVWAAIIPDRDRDNPFEFVFGGVWKAMGGTTYNFECEVLEEVRQSRLAERVEEKLEEEVEN